MVLAEALERDRPFDHLAPERVGAASALGGEGGQELRVALVAGGRVEERLEEPFAASRACPACRGPCRGREDLADVALEAAPVFGSDLPGPAEPVRGGELDHVVRFGGPCSLLVHGAHGTGAATLSCMLASVITPTKNRPAELGRALRSLLAQDSADWEAIVVDDGAGEGIAAAEAFGDARITAIASPGSGQVDARNAGIARASGRLVCWLDDDDWWADPGHLSLLRREAATPGFYFRSGWIVHEDGSREVFDHDATAASLRVNNTVLTSSLAYPRELHDSLGPLDAALGSYGDWDFMLRMCDAGLEPRKLPGLGVCYAIHDRNVSTDFDAPARREGFERFARKHGLEIRIANHVTIHRLLMSVPDGWAEVDDALEREFKFDDFVEAMAFVNRVAELAESEDHHPDIDIRWNRVTLRWSTHSAGGITDRDRELAARSAALG